MPSLIDLRRRIRSVNNTQQITKAMKMVSAAKLRRAQNAVIDARPYASLLNSMIGSILQNITEETAVLGHPLLAQRECRNLQLLVLAGDKGLCGSFNSSVMKSVRQFIEGHEGQGIQLELLGRKAVDYYGKRDYPVSGRWEKVFNKVEYDTASTVANKSMELFGCGRVDQVWVLYNSFQSVLNQETLLRQLLPIEPPESEDTNGPGYEYEQPVTELLGSLLPKHVLTNIYLAMLNSAAAEHAARMTAMDSATRNAGDMLDRLTLHLNRVRQASITTEIIEIVSGASALE